jgi:Mn-dependent DtxR family transcriptional regulator
MSNHRERERAAEDFILAADEETLQRLQALIQIRRSQIGSPIFDRESQLIEDSKLQSWRGRTW